MYIVRVVTTSGDYWLGQRVYMLYNNALVVKHNLQDSGRYVRVYILTATQEQISTASVY